MKAIVFDRYGPPEVLHLKDVEKPTPKDNEVLIRIRAATVIAGDCEFRSFNFPLWFWLPLRVYTGLFKPTRVNILGQELAGEIELVGKDVTRFSIGDQVFGPTFGGAYAEYRCMAEDSALAIKPANMTFEEAAAVPTGGLNALHYLRRANIQPGEKVLVNGAGGNIGSFAVQIAKYFGAYVTAVDSTDKLALLNSIGADHVIDYTQEDFSKSGETYDVVFDVVASKTFSQGIRALKENGRYLLVNPRVATMLGGLWTSMTSSKKVVMRFANYKSEDLAYLKELIEAGKVKSVIDKSYPLEQVADAHRYFEAGRRQGHIAITL